MRNLILAIAGLLLLAGTANARTYVAYTATDTLDPVEVGSGIEVTNLGATGAIILTLPNCDAGASVTGPGYAPSVSTLGLEVHVALAAAYDVDLNPTGTEDSIHGPGTIAGGAGDAVSSSTDIGESIDCTCVLDDEWSCTGAGTWTDVN
jgi:hypothetical protein